MRQDNIKKMMEKKEALAGAEKKPKPQEKPKAAKASKKEAKAAEVEKVEKEIVESEEA
jgi:hypothetical protein